MYQFYNEGGLKIRTRSPLQVSPEMHRSKKDILWLRRCFLSPNAKLFTILMVLVFVCLSAKAQEVTLSKSNASISEVFRDIKKQTGYDFVYSSKLLEGAKPVTIHTTKLPLSEVLAICFKDQPFSYKVVAKTIIVVKKVPDQKTADAGNKDVQEDLVHGKVYNEKNEPLPGATLRVVNGRVSAVTDEQGGYVIIGIPQNAILTVSYIGYKSDTVAVEGRNEVIFHLRADAMTMKEVVISTGYQTLNKDRVSGSFAKPDMAVFSARTGTNDVLQRIDGLVPGLTVLTGTGSTVTNRAGQTTQQVLVRGASSVNLATQPLYVVNGVQVDDLSSINPNDVGDITVLKDASAAAIWGARAANGVIVITTKTGKKNQPIKVNYNAFFNYQGKPDLNYQPRLSSAQYIQVARELFNPALYPYTSLSTSFVAPHEQILYNQQRGLISAAQANSSLDSLSRINNLSQIKDLWYRNAFTSNQSVSASGGSGPYSFYSSLSYIVNHSTEVGASDKTYRVYLNQSFNPNKNLKITLNTSLNLADRKSARPASVGAYVLPYQLFQDANDNNLNMNYVQGLTPETRADYQARSRVNLDYNPLNEINSGFTNYNALTANVTGEVSQKIWKGLSFQGTYGYQKTPANNVAYDDISKYSMRQQLVSFTVAPTANSTPVYYLPNSGGRYVNTNTDLKNWTVRNQLVFNTTLRSGKDQLNIQAGQEAQEQIVTTRSNVVYGYDLNLETYPVLDYIRLNNGVFGTVSSGRSVLGLLPFTTNETKTRYTSYFGLLNYTFDNRYALDGSIRSDRSNLFAAAQSGPKKPAYSIGGKWLVSHESWFNTKSWVNDLNLRTTYGITGNSPYLGAAALQDILYAETNSITGNALSLYTPANTTLSWETTRTINIGIDFAILNYRLSGSIDVYSKHTTDLIGSEPTNALTGFTSITGNIGQLNNKGIELSLRSVNIKTNNFTWNTAVTFSYNQNKLLRFTEPTGIMLNDSYRLTGTYVAGYSLSPLFAYRYAGLDNLGDPQIKLANGKIAKNYGAATANDLVYMGTRTPKFNGGITNTFTYKNLSLTANIIYNLGAVMRRDVNTFYSGRLTGSAGSFTGNINPEFLNRWQKPGDEAITNIPSYVADPFADFRRNTQYYTLADINVVSASYIKLRDVTLNYNLPAKLVHTLKLNAVNVFVQSGNFLLWKANKYGIDPEYQDFISGGRGLPPYSHNYSLGVNVTF